jgi:hydrogenase maturation protease
VEGPAVSQALQIALTIGAQMLEDGACKLRIEVQNTTPLPSGAEAMREEALPLSLVSAHLVLGVTNGEFVSLLDPAEAYRASAAACSNTGVFPVLAGEEPDRRMMLCSPIILYDYPKIAPESAGDFFDGTEMDEMLTLRVLTLTDAEKEEMRSGDPRARRILERTESLTEDAMLKAHGVIRGLREIRGDAS